MVRALDTATIVKALSVLQEGSIHGASRLLSKPSSSIGDAFERIETLVGTPLALRTDRTLSLTLSGQSLREAYPEIIAYFSDLYGIFSGSDERSLSSLSNWIIDHSIPLTYLHDFNSVLDQGSIQKAARQTDTGQPHLSKKMSKLERILQKKLIERDISGCSATEYGVAFRRISLKILSWTEKFIISAAETSAHHQNPLKFGTIIPLSHEGRLARRLAAVLSQWTDSDEQRNLLISATTAEELIQGLKTRTYDIVLLDTKLSIKKFDSLEIFSSELVLVGPKKFSGYSIADIYSNLKKENIAIPSNNSGMRHEIIKAFDVISRDFNLNSEKHIEVDALSIIINLIMTHDYFSLLTIDSVSFIKNEVAIFPLPGRPLLRFYLVWHKISLVGNHIPFISSILKAH